MSTRFTVSLAVLLTAGCAADAPPGPPPIEFSFRESQIPTRGMVMGIRNTSTNETIEGVTVTVRSPDDGATRSHVIDAPIRPQDTITVGWIELDGWKLRPGDEVTVKSARYAEPKAATVPEL